MRIYGSSLSPYVRKVLAFATEKDISIESIPVILGSTDVAFRSASPFGKMPAIEHEGFVLSDSSAIVTYMETLAPSPQLIPSDPKSRAKTVWFDEFGDTIIGEVARDIFFNKVISPKLLGKPGDLDCAERAERDGLPPILDYLEANVPDSGFLVEDRLTLADLAVASPWANLGHIGIMIDPATHPRAAAYVSGVLRRPSFALLLAKEQTFIGRLGHL